MSRIERALEDALLRRKSRNEEVAAGTPEQRKEQALEAPNVSLRIAPSPPDGNIYDLSAVSPVVATVLQESSPVGEEYRRICLNILKQLRTGQGNVILVTSSVRGEGKTVTALNIACILARSIDHTVLLVDTDLRKPSVHEYLGLKPSQGLSDYLRGEDIRLSELMIRPGLGKLVVLQGGSAVENPSELLTSSKMETMISELKARYPDRFIILDSGPVLEVADPVAMAAWMDGVVFVVREGAVPQKTIVEGFESLIPAEDSAD